MKKTLSRNKPKITHPVAECVWRIYIYNIICGRGGCFSCLSPRLFAAHSQRINIVGWLVFVATPAAEAISLHLFPIFHCWCWSESEPFLTSICTSSHVEVKVYDVFHLSRSTYIVSFGTAVQSKLDSVHTWQENLLLLTSQHIVHFSAHSLQKFCPSQTLQEASTHLQARLYNTQQSHRLCSDEGSVRWCDHRKISLEDHASRRSTYIC